MRSLLILLLLIYKLLSAADATLACDRSLINVVDSSEIHFDDATKILTCVSGGNSLMAIVIDKLDYYAFFTCDPVDGWKARVMTSDGYEYVKEIQKASVPLNIGCVEYCATTGVGINVAKKMKSGSYPSLEISCTDSYAEELFYGQSLILEPTCNLYAGWTWKRGYNEQEFHYNKKSKTVQFECKKDYPPRCDRSLIKGVPASAIHFDNATKTLRCVAGENSFMAIELNSQRYESFSCDKYDGWKAKKLKPSVHSSEEREESVADASTLLNIACVKYCATTGVGVKVEKKGEQNNFIVVSCEHYQYLGNSYNEKLFYGQLRIYKAYCQQGYYEWTLEPEEELTASNTMKMFTGQELEFECRLETPLATATERDRHADLTIPSTTTTTIQPSTTNTTEEMDWPKCDLSLINGVEPSEMHFDNATDTLTCVNGGISLTAIKYNGNYFEYLTCEGDVWRVGDTAIHNATKPLTIACVEYCVAIGVGIKMEKKIQFGRNHSVEISCAEPYPEELFYGQSHIVEANCNLYVGWAWKHGYNGNAVEYQENRISKIRTVQFECRKDSRLKCDRSLINVVDSSEIHFDDDVSNTLTCVGGENTLMAIEFNSQRYVSLTCDRSQGWQSKTSDGALVVSTVAASTATLNIACVQYCATTGATVKIERQIHNYERDTGLIEVFCPGKYLYERNKYMEQLFYGQKHVHRAFCSLDGPMHWIFVIDDNEFEPVYRPDNGKPVKFECRPVLPTAITTTKWTTKRNRLTTASNQREGNEESTKTFPITSTTTAPSTTKTPEEKGAVPSAEAQSGTQTSLIAVGCSVGGFMLGAIVVVVIFLLFLAKKKRPESSGMSATEEGMKKNKKHGGNDGVQSDADNVSSGR